MLELHFYEALLLDSNQYNKVNSVNILPQNSLNQQFYVKNLVLYTYFLTNQIILS